ncbi:hypothetical protein BC629DRAFT_1586483 [Irpex lacteus]|nr:hypothetical protein BC629DRAFT_1586483 [Irpex lacteus]
MKFFSTAAVLLAATVASVNAAALDVWAPAVLSPKAGDVWTSGEHVSVTWDLSSKPVNITNKIGFILLRSGNSDTPVVLAHDFQLADGSVGVTVPDVLTGDYSLTLFGDSGDHSAVFHINGPVTE